MRSSGILGLLLVVRLAKPVAIGEPKVGFMEYEPEGDAARGE